MFTHIEEPQRVVTAPWVRRLKAGQGLECKIMDCHPQWIVTHFHETKGTLPCEARRDPKTTVVLDENGCLGCKHHDPVRPRGYLYIWHPNQSRYEFLELTLVKWCEIKEAGNGSSDLRGCHLKIWRGKTDNARMRFTLSNPDPSEWAQKYPFVPNVDASLKVLMRK